MDRVTIRLNPLSLRLKLGAEPTTGTVPLILRPLAPGGATPTSVGSVIARRNKIWELSRHLHCSIIGTCLSTDELRRILSKAGLAAEGASDHELHGQGVLVAAQQGMAAKLLHKALDKRHRQAVNQFEKANAVDEVAALWREALKAGEVPGAYWAVLTHAAATDALIRRAFGEVHMLSHLVGAANRADIRRLSALEADNMALQEKVKRQEVQLREGMTSRDNKIRELGALLARRLADDARRERPDGAASEQSTITKLVADLERRQTVESRRRAAIEQRLVRMTAELKMEQDSRRAAEVREAQLRDELDAIDAGLTTGASDEPPTGETNARLDGFSLLYVGGRPHQLTHVRALGEQLGANVLLHDGGVDERTGLLAGLVSRADVVMFPVDCVSHNAVAAVKRLCRQASKPFVPLRSGGVSSFVAALNRVDVFRARVTAAATHGLDA